jgi:hypothetical protein
VVVVVVVVVVVMMRERGCKERTELDTKDLQGS